jgi:hypothetical protein
VDPVSAGGAFWARPAHAAPSHNAAARYEYHERAYHRMLEG